MQSNSTTQQAVKLLPIPDYNRESEKEPYWTGEYSRNKANNLICSNKLRIEVLFQNEGRCYICRIEEWRTKKRLQMHRVICGRNGGAYVPGNVVPLCRKCHTMAEYHTRASIDAMRTEAAK